MNLSNNMQSNNNRRAGSYLKAEYKKPDILYENPSAQKQKNLSMINQQLEEKSTIWSLLQQIVMLTIIIIIFAAFEMNSTGEYESKNNIYQSLLTTQLALASIVAASILLIFVFNKELYTVKMLGIFFCMKVVLALVTFFIVESISILILTELEAFQNKLSQFYLGLLLFRILDSDFNLICIESKNKDSIGISGKLIVADKLLISFLYLSYDISLTARGKICNLCVIFALVVDSYRVIFWLVVCVKSFRKKASKKYVDINTRLCTNCLNPVTGFLNNNDESNKLNFITEEKFINVTENLSQNNEVIENKVNIQENLESSNFSMDIIKTIEDKGNFFFGHKPNNAEKSKHSMFKSKDIFSSREISNCSKGLQSPMFCRESNRKTLKSEEVHKFSESADENVFSLNKNYNGNKSQDPNDKGKRKKSNEVPNIMIKSVSSNTLNESSHSDYDGFEKNCTEKLELDKISQDNEFTKTAYFYNSYKKNNKKKNEIPQVYDDESLVIRNKKNNSVNINENMIFEKFDIRRSTPNIFPKSTNQYYKLGWNFLNSTNKAQDTIDSKNDLDSEDLVKDDSINKKKIKINLVSPKKMNSKQYKKAQMGLKFANDPHLKSFIDSILWSSKAADTPVSDNNITKNSDKKFLNLQTLANNTTPDKNLSLQLLEKINSLPKALCISKMSDILKTINTGIIIFNEDSILCLSNICEMAMKNKSENLLNYRSLEECEKNLMFTNSETHINECKMLITSTNYQPKFHIQNIFKNYQKQKIFISDKNLLDVIKIYNYLRRKNLVKLSDFKSLEIIKNRVVSFNQKGFQDNSLNDIMSNYDIQSKLEYLSQEDSENFDNDTRILRGHVYMKELVLLFTTLQKHLSLFQQKEELTKLLMHFPIMVTFFYNELKITITLLDLNSKDVRSTMCFLINNITEEIRTINLEEKQDFIFLMMNSVNHDIRTPQNFLAFNNDHILDHINLQYTNILSQKKLCKNSTAFNKDHIQNRIDILFEDMKVNYDFIQNGTEAINKMIETIELVIKSVTELTIMTPERFILKLETFELSKCIENIFMMFSDQMKEKGLKDSIMVSTNLIGVKWQTDRVKFEQILSILLNNAIKYSHEDKKVQVCVTKVDDDLVQISIRNKCDGLSKERISQLESIFYDHLTRVVPENCVGIGLSLRIASGLLRFMGKKGFNKIKIQSKKKFVEVTFYLKYFKENEVLEGGRILDKTNIETNSNNTMEEIYSRRSCNYLEHSREKNNLKLGLDNKDTKTIVFKGNSKNTESYSNNYGNSPISDNDLPDLDVFSNYEKDYVSSNVNNIYNTSPKTDQGRCASPNFMSFERRSIPCMDNHKPARKLYNYMRKGVRPGFQNRNQPTNDKKKNLVSKQNKLVDSGIHINAEYDQDIIYEEQVSEEDMKSQKSKSSIKCKTLNSMEQNYSIHSAKSIKFDKSKDSIRKSNSLKSLKTVKDKGSEKILWTKSTTRDYLKRNQKLLRKGKDFEPNQRLIESAQAIEKNKELSFSYENQRGISADIKICLDKVVKSSTFKEEVKIKNSKTSLQVSQTSKKNMSAILEKSKTFSKSDGSNMKLDLLKISDMQEKESSSDDYTTPANHQKRESIIDKSYRVDVLNDDEMILKLSRQNTKKFKEKDEMEKSIHDADPNLIQSKLNTINEEKHSREYSDENIRKSVVKVNPSDVLESVRSLQSRRVKISNSSLNFKPVTYSSLSICEKDSKNSKKQITKSTFEVYNKVNDGKKAFLFHVSDKQLESRKNSCSIFLKKSDVKNSECPKIDNESPPKCSAQSEMFIPRTPGSIFFKQFLDILKLSKYLQQIY